LGGQPAEDRIYRYPDLCRELAQGVRTSLGISNREVAKTILLTYPGGYSLALQEDVADIHRFEQVGGPVRQGGGSVYWYSW
jgi:hypothetical protein